MNTFIALLKGINVGGHKKVIMAELCELLSSVGFKNVRTYIQSGNVIFETEEMARFQIENTIHKAILDKYGFEVSVFVRTRQELKRIFDDCPFSEEKRKSSYFMMLHDTPKEELVKLASKKVYEGEEYKIINDCIYYFNDKGFGKAKINTSFFERNLKTFITARNFRTMLALLEISN